MARMLHITSGDVAGEILKKSGVGGEVLVWRDILYDGSRNPGWPDAGDLEARADFLDAATGGGPGRERILGGLKSQYATLAGAGEFDEIVLWFDACLFDQSMLCHVLVCLGTRGISAVSLICVDAFPGIEPFDGLGQLLPEDLASLYPARRGVTEAGFIFAERVDRAFALRDESEFKALAGLLDAPLPWVPAAVARWLLEWPDEATGLGRLDALVLDALRSGSSAPAEIFAHVRAHDSHPIYWGDTTLWARINGLAARNPPLVKLEGPAPFLPVWDADGKTLAAYRVRPV